MGTNKSKEKHCDYNNFKRARYFHGMLMTDRDFSEEQIYHSEKRKLLNKMLHGWGVVCGLGIEAVNSGSSKIKITPGMALDCNGNEIVVCENIEIDLKEEICLSPPAKQKDVCAETGNVGENKYYIGIKYNEAPTDPVPVYTPGGGCEEKVCDYSRTREGFCIKISNEAPPQPQQCRSGESLADTIYKTCRKIEENGEIDYPGDCMTETALLFRSTYCSKVVCCPECCPADHYIILGTVRLDANINKYVIDQNEKRQYVMSVTFMKYLFASLFNGAEKILADVVDEFKGSDVPDVNLVLNNPIAALCWLSERLLEQKGKQEASKDSQAIKDMNIEKVKEAIVKKDLDPVGTVALTESNKRELIRLSSGVKKLEKNDAVEIVVDKENKTLFYIPAREKVAMNAFKKELNENVKIINELKAEIETLKKRRGR